MKHIWKVIRSFQSPRGENVKVSKVNDFKKKKIPIQNVNVTKKDQNILKFHGSHFTKGILNVFGSSLVTPRGHEWKELKRGLRVDPIVYAPSD